MISLQKIRILPIGIFILAIFLCNKLINFAFSFSENSQAFLNNVSVAFAESEADEASKKDAGLEGEADKKDDFVFDENNIGKKVVDDNGLQEVILDYSNYQKTERVDKLPFKNNYDSEEIKLLEQLKSRREDLIAKEEALKEKEKLLAVTEVKMSKKVEELQHLKLDIQKKIKHLNDEQERQVNSLVKTYESMKPKPAANVFNDLDIAVLIEILERMKEVKKAPIMAVMDAGRVSEITSILATRKKIPA